MTHAAQAAIAAMKTRCECLSPDTIDWCDECVFEGEHGARCANCHGTGSTPMFPDERRTHEFKIHRKEVSGSRFPKPITCTEAGCPGYSVREPNLGRLMKRMMELGIYLSLSSFRSKQPTYEADVRFATGYWFDTITVHDPDAAGYGAALAAADKYLAQPATAQRPGGQA